MSAALPSSVLLVGCGDVAQRLAALLRQDFVFTGLRRQTNDLPAFIAPLSVDIGDACAVQAALAQKTFDYVVITLTPGERNEARYRQVYVDGVQHLLAALVGNPRLLFVSSTSVYAQDAGEVVNERSEAQGKSFSGRCLLEAEQQVSNSRFDATSVRFAGIYGAGRSGRLLERVRAGQVEWTQAAQWTNRIHVEDCARVLAHLIRRWQNGLPPAPVYIASDDCPVQAGDVWQWLAAQMGCADPLMQHSHWRDATARGKRCSNALLRQTGFSLLYPKFTMGYAGFFSNVTKL